MARSQTVMPQILDYRECSKIKSSFCDPQACTLKETGFRIPRHVEYGIADTLARYGKRETNSLFYGSGLPGRPTLSVK